MAASNQALKTFVPAELILNGLFQAVAGYSAVMGAITGQAAAYWSLVGLLIHLILLGYRAISLLIGFLNDVRPMITLSDSVLRELDLKQSGK